MAGSGKVASNPGKFVAWAVLEFLPPSKLVVAQRFLREQFNDRVARLYTWRLAARPLDGSMPTEEIIAELFGTWVGLTFRYPTTVPSDSVSADCARDFCRFGV